MEISNKVSGSDDNSKGEVLTVSKVNQLILGLIGFQVISDDSSVIEAVEVTNNSVAAISQLTRTLLDIDVVHPELGIKAELQAFAQDLKTRVEAGEGEEETNFRPRLAAMYEKYRQYALSSPPFEA